MMMSGTLHQAQRSMGGLPVLITVEAKTISSVITSVNTSQREDSRYIGYQSNFQDQDQRNNLLMISQVLEKQQNQLFKRTSKPVFDQQKQPQHMAQPFNKLKPRIGSQPRPVKIVQPQQKPQQDDQEVSDQDISMTESLISINEESFKSYQNSASVYQDAINQDQVLQSQDIHSIKKGQNPQSFQNDNQKSIGLNKTMEKLSNQNQNSQQEETQFVSLEVNQGLQQVVSHQSITQDISYQTRKSLESQDIPLDNFVIDLQNEDDNILAEKIKHFIKLKFDKKKQELQVIEENQLSNQKIQQQKTPALIEIVNSIQSSKKSERFLSPMNSPTLEEIPLRESIESQNPQNNKQFQIKIYQDHNSGNQTYETFKDKDGNQILSSSQSKIDNGQLSPFTNESMVFNYKNLNQYSSTRLMQNSVRDSSQLSNNNQKQPKIYKIKNNPKLNQQQQNLNFEMQPNMKKNKIQNSIQMTTNQSNNQYLISPKKFQPYTSTLKVQSIDFKKNENSLFSQSPQTYAQNPTVNIQNLSDYQNEDQQQTNRLVNISYAYNSNNQDSPYQNQNSLTSQQNIKKQNYNNNHLQQLRQISHNQQYLDVPIMKKKNNLANNMIKLNQSNRKQSGCDNETQESNYKSMRFQQRVQSIGSHENTSENKQNLQLYDEIYKTLIGNKQSQHTLKDQVKEFLMTPLKIYNIQLFQSNHQESKPYLKDSFIKKQDQQTLSLLRASSQGQLSNYQKLLARNSSHNSLARINKTTIQPQFEQERLIYQKFGFLVLENDLRAFVQVQIAITQTFLYILKSKLDDDDIQRTSNNTESMINQNKIEMRNLNTCLVQITRSNIKRATSINDNDNTPQTQTHRQKRHQNKRFKQIQENIITIEMKEEIDVTIKESSNRIKIQDRCVSGYLMNKEDNGDLKREIQSLFRQHKIQEIKLSFESAIDKKLFQNVFLM